jgi:putative copper resistance protein D
MEPFDVVSVVLRAVAVIAALQAAGLTWFVASCHRAGVAAARPMNRSLCMSALIALVFVLSHRALDAGRLAGEWSGILDSHLQGVAWSRRPGLSTIVCAFGLLGVAVSAARPQWWGGNPGSVAGFAVVGSFALTGHTTEAAHAGWLQWLVALHAGLVGYWIGAIAGLYWLTRLPGAGGVARAASQFSATAVWLVPLILPVGAVLIWGLVPDLAALRTPYGGFLLAKALGFGALILLAASNRFRGLPALAAGAPGAVRTFRRTLGIEYVVLCSVLSATATMTSLFSWH